MILVPDLADIERRASSDAERTFARLLQRCRRRPGRSRLLLGEAALARLQAAGRGRFRHPVEAGPSLSSRSRAAESESTTGSGTPSTGTATGTSCRPRRWNRRSRPRYALRDILREEGLGWFAARGRRHHTGHRLSARRSRVEANALAAHHDMSSQASRAALDAIVAAAPSCPAEADARPHRGAARPACSASSRGCR